MSAEAHKFNEAIYEPLFASLAANPTEERVEIVAEQTKPLIVGSPPLSKKAITINTGNAAPSLDSTVDLLRLLHENPDNNFDSAVAGIRNNLLRSAKLGEAHKSDINSHVATILDTISEKSPLSHAFSHLLKVLHQVKSAIQKPLKHWACQTFAPENPHAVGKIWFHDELCLSGLLPFSVVISNLATEHKKLEHSLSRFDLIYRLLVSADGLLEEGECFDSTTKEAWGSAARFLSNGLGKEQFRNFEKAPEMFRFLRSVQEKWGWLWGRNGHLKTSSVANNGANHRGTVMEPKASRSDILCQASQPQAQTFNRAVFEPLFASLAANPTEEQVDIVAEQMKQLIVGPPPLSKKGLAVFARHIICERCICDSNLRPLLAKLLLRLKNVVVERPGSLKSERFSLNSIIMQTAEYSTNSCEPVSDAVLQRLSLMDEMVKLKLVDTRIFLRHARHYAKNSNADCSVQYIYQILRNYDTLVEEGVVVSEKLFAELNQYLCYLAAIFRLSEPVSDAKLLDAKLLEIADYLISKSIQYGHTHSAECGNLLGLPAPGPLTTLKTGNAAPSLDSTVDLLRSLREERSEETAKLASLRVRVAKEFHRFILGKGAKTLTRIEQETGTHIRLPRADDANADTISITGSNECLHKAARAIQAIVDEQSKTDRRVLNIPQQFHQLLTGPSNQVLSELLERCGGSVRIHMPPKVGNVEKPDEIVVTGDREPVGKVAEELVRLYEAKKKTCETLNLTIPKQKHKYIIGTRGIAIQEIFAATGVAIKVPPRESESDQVTLFGEGDKIGQAVSLVLQKADSSNRVEVAAPGWLQRYLKPTIDNVKAECPKVHIDFATMVDHITLEGPTQDVDKVQKIFEEATVDLLKRLKYAEVKVNPKYYRHLIGRDGKQITQLRNETGVNIMFPDEKAEKPSDIIRIEGEVQQVEIARKKLMEVVARIENETAKEILIEKRYHRFLVAKKSKLYESFPEVYISFPKQEEKSDVVEIRGPKAEVDKAYKFLQKMYEEVQAENYEVPVNVMKQFHKRIIGKHGANVAKIREQTHVEIDLPPPNSDSQKVLVRGRKENVEKAIVMIEDMQRAFENISEIQVEIPHKFHEALIGPRGASIQAIQQECENVIIRFPNEKDKGTDKITIVGPKEEVEIARKMLIQRANDAKETSYSEELRVKPEFHRYLIGRKGQKVREIYQETKARVVFPDSEAKGEDAEIVVIIGRVADVKKARKLFDAQVRYLEETKEETIQIDPRFHKHFVSRKGLLVNAIASECGRVTISFPRQGTESSEVSIKGPKECVSEAAKRMIEEVEKMKKLVTIEVQIPTKYRHSLLGCDGSKVFNIDKKFDVHTVFPQSQREGIKNSGQRGGKHGEETTPRHSPLGAEPGQEQMMTVTITGLEEACHAARDALLALVPVSEEVKIPHEYHRTLIGQKGAAIREITEKYDVNVSFPDSSQQCDTVKVIGSQMGIKAATDALLERVRQVDAEKEHRKLLSFKLSVKVNPLLQRKLIGRGWAMANQLMKKFGVNLTFPPRNGQADDEVIITGYEAKCHEAKAEIERIVGPIDMQLALDMAIDRRFIPRLLGPRGSNIQQLMEQYKVKIIVPQNEANGEEMVTIQIVGAEDDVYLCRNNLEVLQEDALLDMRPAKNGGQYAAGEQARRGALGRSDPHFQLPNGSETSEASGKSRKS